MESLTKTPAKITAGDSVQFTIELTAYPATDWTLSCSLVRDGAVISISSAADGVYHYVSIPAAITAEYSPGKYRYQAYVSARDQRVTVETGEIEIRPNFAGQSTG